MLSELSNPLIIAEKPDMAKHIAKQLPAPHKRGDGYIQTGHGIVTWAFGHLLEQAQPQDYDPKYEKWVYDDLPIVPSEWKVYPVKSKARQIKVIKELLKQCSDVVNAGDPGREGQLIVDEILEHLRNRKPVWRLLLDGLDSVTVKEAFKNLQTNQVFASLYDAALGRQRADWMVGMNLTRAYTIKGREQGYGGVLSVGRVQTPTLAIVVRREEEIEGFIPKPYWTLAIQAQSDPSFWATWWAPKAYRNKSVDADEEGEGEASSPSEGQEQVQQQASLPDWLDEKGRIVSEEKARAIIEQVKAHPEATVVSCQKKRVQEKQPLPFELSDMQSRMNAKMGATLKEVQDVCQKLYDETYLTYPRTDSPYLKESQHAQAPDILRRLSAGLPQWADMIAKTDTRIKSRAWNDKKIDEHSGIIPTGNPPNLDSLSPLERAVYETSLRSYLAQFFPPCIADKTTIELEAADHSWGARGRVVVDPGWRVVYGAEDPGDHDKEEGATEEGDGAVLPDLSEGDRLSVSDTRSQQKTTKPPSRYTQGSLVKVMQHIDRLVDDPVEKKKLRTVKGIGRSATRTAIVSTLVKRGYLLEKKKHLIPSNAAKVIVRAVDPNLIDPGLTARWEQALDSVATGKVPLDTFQKKQEQWVRQLLSVMQNKTISGLEATQGGGAAKPSESAIKAAGPNPGPCPKCGKDMVQRVVRKGKYQGKVFWSCSGYPDCKHSVWPEEKPSEKALKAAGDNPGPCPKCGKDMVQRVVRQGKHKGKVFWSCSGYPTCQHSVWPKDDSAPKASAAALKAAGNNPGPCPKCGKDMVQRVVRQGKHKGKVFWSCSGYPDCKHSIWPS